MLWVNLNVIPLWPLCSDREQKRGVEEKPRNIPRLLMEWRPYIRLPTLRILSDSDCIQLYLKYLTVSKASYKAMTLVERFVLWENKRVRLDLELNLNCFFVLFSTRPRLLCWLWPRFDLLSHREHRIRLAKNANVLWNTACLFKNLFFHPISAVVDWCIGFF